MSAAAQKLRTAMSDAERKLRNARSVVVQAHTFFGTLLLRQKIVEASWLQTMATDGENLYFNPEFVLKTAKPELEGVCAHEALHPGFCHHLRRGDRDHKVWNEACDYAINPILVDAKIALPKTALLRDDLRGMNAEKIYAKLIQERLNAPSGGGQGKPSDQKGGSAGGDPGAAGSPGNDAGAGQPQPGQQQPKDDGRPASARGDRAQDVGGTGCVLDGATNEADKSAKESDWKVAMSQAATAAGAGNIPGSLETAIDELLEPKADWRDLLRRFMDHFARADYSWRSPNRRFVSDGLYLPELRSESLPPIAFVIDASASMPQNSLAQALSEVESIVSELQPERLDVVVHDTAVRFVKSFEPDEPIGEFRVAAGGGTIFGSVCKWLNEQPEQYACVIWFTDLEPNDKWADIEKQQPISPVLWIDYGDGKKQPTFGEDVVRLPRSAP